MVEHLKNKSLTWVDLQRPTASQIRDIVEECAIPPELAADWGGPVARSGVSAKDDAVKVTLDFPLLTKQGADTPYELKCIVTKGTLITVRYEDNEAFHRFKKTFEVVTTLYTTKKHTSGMHLFVALLDALYTTLQSKLDYVETKLSDIENEIFKEREKEMVFELSHLTRRMILFRHTVGVHKEILREVRTYMPPDKGRTACEALEALLEHHAHLTRRTAALFENLEELRRTNNALLTTKQSEIMKIFTILAFVTFPLTLLTSIFGMNTTTMPLVGTPGDFWIIVSAMSIATVGFFFYFKYKRWI